MVLTPGGPSLGAVLGPPNQPTYFTASAIVYGFSGGWTSRSEVIVLFAAQYSSFHSSSSAPAGLFPIGNGLYASLAAMLPTSAASRLFLKGSF
jgi:hypothetical protein